MDESDLTGTAMSDRDTMLLGLAGIGVRLYEDSNDAPAGSILGAERAVFARHFDPVWRTLTNDDRRWLREKLDDEDGAFSHMVADFESRNRQRAMDGVDG